MIVTNGKKMRHLNALSADEFNADQSVSEDPSLVLVVNLDKITRKQENACLTALSAKTKKLKECIFLVDESHIERFEDNRRLKFNQNVAFGRIVGADVGDQHKNALHPHFVMISDPENFSDFESLKYYSWVILSCKGLDRTRSLLASIAKIIDFCNKKRMCISTSPHIPIDVVKTIASESDIDMSDLRYELPITESHIVLMGPSEVEDFVEKIKKNIIQAVNAETLATMSIAFNLYHLDQIAKKVGQKSFWLANFDVSSMEEYAMKVIGISRSMAFRYIQAMKVSEIVMPGTMLDVSRRKINLPKKVLSYSRFLTVSPFLKDIENSSESEMTDVKDLLLDPEVSAGTLKTQLSLKFKKESSDPIEFYANKYLNGVETKLKKNQPESQHETLMYHLSAIRALFEPEDSQVEITNDPSIVKSEIVQSDITPQLTATIIAKA